MRATVAWLGLGALLLALGASRRASGSMPVQILGPLAEVAASVQWVRFQNANLRGEQERALLLAESALRLDPRTTDGWEHLARHLALFLASPERGIVLLTKADTDPDVLPGGTDALLEGAAAAFAEARVAGVFGAAELERYARER